MFHQIFQLTSLIKLRRMRRKNSLHILLLNENKEETVLKIQKNEENLINILTNRNGGINKG